MSGLSNSQIDALTYIEQVWWETGSMPTDEQVAEQTGIKLETVRRYWRDETFRGALQARGVTFDNQAEKRTLTMQQLMAANAVMNTMDRRSLREKCKQLEISVQQLNAWMRQPAFQEHLRKRAETLLRDATPAAHRGLVAAIEGGDLKAIQLFYEMTGIYSPKVTHEVNVTVVLSRVVEIIGKHVQDPDILLAIATEIEELETGSSQVALAPVPQLKI